MSEIEQQLPAEVVETLNAARAATSRVERLKRLGILYIVVVLTLMAAVMGWSALTNKTTLDAVRQTQVESNKRGIDIKASSSNSEQILQTLTDCLTPGGKCYQRGQQNQREALQQVGRLYTYAGLCLQNPAVPQNTNAQQACVAHLIERYGLDGSKH